MVIALTKILLRKQVSADGEMSTKRTGKESVVEASEFHVQELRKRRVNNEERNDIQDAPLQHIGTAFSNQGGTGPKLPLGFSRPCPCSCLLDSLLLHLNLLHQLRLQIVIKPLSLRIPLVDALLPLLICRQLRK